jgi:hypothetical protein
VTGPAIARASRCSSREANIRSSNLEPGGGIGVLGRRGLNARRRQTRQGRNFVTANYPDHPTDIDWYVRKEGRVDARDLRLRIVGMSTVWLSDRLDGKHVEEGPIFVPNLAVSRHQFEAALAGADDDELILLLTHHPAEWLEAGSQQLLYSYLQSRPHVHLWGHVHRKMTRFEHQLGRPGVSVRLFAGATHDEDHAQVEHTYSWGAIRRRCDRWELGWAPRVYVPEPDAMRPDHLRYDLGDEGFAWAPLT